MMLFKINSDGWPVEMVNQAFDSIAPSGHVAFQTWADVDGWKAANEDKRPRDAQVSAKPAVPPSVEM